LLTVGLRAAAPFLTGRVWSLDHLRYLSSSHPAPFGFIAASVILVVYLFSRRVANGDLPPGKTATRSRIGIGLAALAATLWYVLLWGFSDATHLLGDGGHVLLNAVAKRSYLSEPLPGLLNAGAVIVFGRAGMDPLQALALVSRLLGVLFFLLVFITSPVIAGDRLRARAVFCGLLLAAGGSQLFFGYIESYPLLYLMVAATLLTILGALAGRLHPAWCSLAFSLSIASHVSALVLLPAYLYFLYTMRLPKGQGLWHFGAMVVPLTAVPLLAAWLGVQIVWPRYAGGDVFVPVIGDYALLSASHVTDILNQLLLVVPAIIPLAMLLAPALRLHRNERAVRFLALACAGAGTLLFVVNPTLGMARDWDLFATVGLVMTISLTYLFFALRQGLHLAPMITCTAILCVAPWIAVNHDSSAAVRRFRDLLRLDASRPGSVYGYETLAVFLREQGDLAGAASAYEEALELRPGFPRYVGALAKLKGDLGDFAAARSLLEGALALDQANESLLYDLAIVEVAAGHVDSARIHFQSLAQRSELKVPAKIALAKLSMSERDYESAVGELVSVLGLDPRHPEAHYLLGIAFIAGGDCESASLKLEEAQALGFQDVDLAFHLGRAYWLCGRTKEAETSFRAFLERKSEGPMAAMARKSLQSIQK
jgi:Flp pilus assembly protein TadD